MTKNLDNCVAKIYTRVMSNFTGNVHYSYDTGIVDYTTDLDLGSWTTTMPTTATYSPYTITPTSTTAGSVFVSTGTGTWSTATNPIIANNKGTMTLMGPDADIVVNGVSLMGAIRKIEERLAILHPAEALEADWAELKRLGDEYRALEAEIRKKMEVWETLKKQNL